MFKMTFTLAVALYAGFVIWGTPSEDLTTEDSARDFALSSATSTEFAQPVIMTSDRTADPAVTRAALSDVVVPDAATIAASAPSPDTSRRGSPARIGDPLVISLVQPGAPDPTEPQGSTSQADGAEFYKVSGNRVNMRSGPSTSDAVVDSLPGGTLTELIGAEQDGWIEIRDVVSGQTGFMAARFLEPA